MEDYISYDYLWQLCQKEKQTNQLLLIPKTFYEDMSVFIASLDPSNEKSMQIKSNAIKMLGEFFENRKQKILFYVAHNRTLPQPLCAIEVEFYDSVVKVMKSSRLELGNVKSSRTALKSLVDIPEIMLPSGGKLGPLKKDQLIESAFSDADMNFLLANAVCANSE
jgi:DNA replication initiation complex subunit (GINS family)